MNCVCERCNKEYEYRVSSGCSKIHCRSCTIFFFRKKLKEKAVEFLGGKCEICGYNRCVYALEFHHVDKNKKSFGLSSGGIARSWKRVLNEIKKCVLLCSNCHKEVESGIVTLPDILVERSRNTFNIVV
jgi:hypothetical protein